MSKENEMIMLLLGVGILVLIWVNHDRLKRIPESKILISSFCFLLAGWAMTVLEDFFFGRAVNYLEHICYTLSSVLMLIWSWRLFGKKQESEDASRFCP